MKRAGLMVLGLFFLAQIAQADWSAVQRLSWTSGKSYDAAITIDSGGAIHVVWSDDTPGNYEIYYKKGN